MDNIQETKKQPKIKLDFKDSKYATGRRKTSIAKVWLKKGSGKIYVPAFTIANGSLQQDFFNFGNSAATIASGNSDGNGYGNFEYAVPSGYYALNTKNLAEFG